MVVLLRTQSNKEFIDEERNIRNKIIELNKKFVDKFNGNQNQTGNISAPLAPPGVSMGDINTADLGITTTIDGFEETLRKTLVDDDDYLMQLDAYKDNDDIAIDYIERADSKSITDLQTKWNKIISYYKNPGTVSNIKIMIKNRLQSLASLVQNLTYVFERLIKVAVRVGVNNLGTDNEAKILRHLRNFLQIYIYNFTILDLIQENLLRNTFEFITPSIINLREKQIYGRLKNHNIPLFEELKHLNYNKKVEDKINKIKYFKGYDEFQEEIEGEEDEKGEEDEEDEEEAPMVEPLGEWEEGEEGEEGEEEEEPAPAPAPVPVEEYRQMITDFIKNTLTKEISEGKMTTEDIRQLTSIILDGLVAATNVPPIEKANIKAQIAEMVADYLDNIGFSVVAKQRFMTALQAQL